MGLKRLTGILLFVPVFLFAINSSVQLDLNTSNGFLKTLDTTIPVKNIDAKVTHLEKKALKIFPNPVKEVLIIGTLNAKSDVANTVHIFDKLGQLVYQNTSIVAENNQIRIKTESLKPGVYYLKVNKGSISKFIKI